MFCLLRQYFVLRSELKRADCEACPMYDVSSVALEHVSYTYVEVSVLATTSIYVCKTQLIA